jgi:hypothetical protein
MGTLHLQQLSQTLNLRFIAAFRQICIALCNTPNFGRNTSQVNFSFYFNMFQAISGLA